MRLVAKVYEEDGVAHVVQEGPPTTGTVDLMFDAWKIVYMDELRAYCGEYVQRKVKALNTNGGGNGD